MNIRYRKSATTGDAKAYATDGKLQIEVTFDSGFWRGVDDNWDEASEQTGFSWVAQYEGDDRVRFSEFLGAPEWVQRKARIVRNFLTIVEPHEGLKLAETEVNG